MQTKLNSQLHKISMLAMGSDEREAAPARVWCLGALMATWGVAAWVGVNALYVQLPLLVNILPEGWALPSHLVLVVQLANVGPLVLALARRLRPSLRDQPPIYALLTLSILATALNAFLHGRVAGSRSVAFLALAFCVSLVGCTSSLLFYPHLRLYRPRHLVPYLFGEGLGGFLPALLALAQGSAGLADCSSGEAVYPHPRFSVGAFLLAIAAFSACSLIAFALIDNCIIFRAERTPIDEFPSEGGGGEKRTGFGSMTVAIATMGAASAFANGVLPSVQSYSCLPYGPLAYHLAATLSAASNPAACLLGVWFPRPRLGVLAVLVLTAAACSIYAVVVALLAPEPPLWAHSFGSAHIVSVFVLGVGSLSYLRMWAAGVCRDFGERSMRTCGWATQVSSAAGSLLLYALVNHTGVFVSSDVCSTPTTYKSYDTIDII